jgi:choline dehydrogenase-like flavoprotein
MFVNGPLSDATHDYLVIGLGPAGVTLALELGKGSKRVLVLESGEEGQSRGELANSIGYGHYSGTYWNAHSVRAPGGTSNVWSGWCTTLRDIDFDNPAVGVSWPISRSDLLPYYRRAADILDRHGSIVDFEKSLFGGFLYRPYSRNSPTRFIGKYVDVLRNSATIDVVGGCTAVGFDAVDSRRFVRAVRYFHHASGTTHQLSVTAAQSIVLAAGGIGNAQLLLQPRSDGSVPVGNESGQVGKFIMEHPHFYDAAEVVLDEDLDRHAPPVEFGRSEHTLVADSTTSTTHRLFGCSLTCHGMTTGHELTEYLSRESGRPFYHYRVDLRAEMLPSPGNRVFLTGERDRTGLYRPGVRCVIDAGDFMNAETTLRVFGEALIQAKKGRIRILNDRIYKQLRGGGHIMGTTTMGSSASASVVDRNCRVHGYGNLFIVGSSVFPTGGYANPTLTIVALALRLAEQLATRG